jgi:voltage-gated potassium channel
MRQLRLASLLIGICIAVGTAGFMLIGGYPFADAVYQTVHTLATVGYGEIHPLDAEGRWFVTALILTNLSVFLYAITTATSFVFDGRAQHLLHQRRQQLMLEELHKHTIVCGYGRIGSRVVDELLYDEVPFVIVETDPKRLEALRQRPELLYYEGDATSEATLEAVGITRANALITTLPKDADNVFTVLSAREANPAVRIVSRASNDSAERKLMKAGCDHVILPERLGGTYMAQVILKPDVMDFVELLSSTQHLHFLFESIGYDDLRPELRNRPIGEFRLELTGATVVGLRYSDKRFEVNPPASCVLESGMVLLVLGDNQQQAAARQLLCHTNP